MGSTLMGPCKSNEFWQIGEKVHPGTFGNIKIGQREYPKSPSVEKHEIRSDIISADPSCPFPNAPQSIAINNSY